MTVTPAEVMSQNLKAWNEVAPRHAELTYENVRRQIAAGTGHFLDSVMRTALEAQDLSGKTVVQFNCNNGRELLSAMQLGAKRGFGFDFSHEFIEQARALSKEAGGFDVEFVETNIYEIPDNYLGVGDVLMATSGALCWMPDLAGYFAAARRVLKPGSSIVVYETHPFLEMFKLDRDRQPDEGLNLHYPYFMAHPVESHSGLDYYSHQVYGSEVVYWYHHTLSGILQGIIDGGFAIRTFQEFEHDTDSGYDSVREFAVRPPMSYLVVAVAD
jgi:SAM-dependent methyltransferase